MGRRMPRGARGSRASRRTSSRRPRGRVATRREATRGRRRKRGGRPVSSWRPPRPDYRALSDAIASMSAACPAVKIPAEMAGTRITLTGGRLEVADEPILPVIEGDGTGPDILRASVRVLDAAVAKAYGGARPSPWAGGFGRQECFEPVGPWPPGGAVRG